MTDPALLEALERVYGRISRSFIRYVVEMAFPYMAPSGAPGVKEDWERRALNALQAWDSDVQAAQRAIFALLGAEKVHPVLPTWNLEYSQYHMLSPLYLLRPVIHRMRPHLATLREEAKALRGWPEAEAEVESLLEKEEAHLRGLEALERERPRDPPKPAVKKGVSANFW